MVHMQTYLYEHNAIVKQCSGVVGIGGCSVVLRGRLEVAGDTLSTPVEQPGHVALESAGCR